MVTSQLWFQIVKYFHQQLPITNVDYDTAVRVIPKLAFSHHMVFNL